MLNDGDASRNMVAIARAIPTLSPAELKVCALILEQKSTREIAEVLFVSERTIHNHRFSIRRKMGVEGNLTVALLAVVGR